MHYTFILNPTAGGGRARKRQAALVRALDREGVDYRLEVTQRPGHATSLAREAAVGSGVVVAVGGDGTIHEVAAGLLEAGTGAALGIIPMGSGNDLIKNIGVPKGLRQALRVALGAGRRPLDCGRIRWSGAEEAGETIFMNIAGAGIDAWVADAVAGKKNLPGSAAYLAVLPRLLREWRAPEVRITTRDLPGTLFSGALLLLTIGNGTCSGGMFYLTPDACIDDGLLDVCMVAEQPMSRVLKLVLLATRGLHTRAPEVRMERLTHLVLHSETPIFVHVDGEVASRAATEVEVSTIPGALSVAVSA